MMTVPGKEHSKEDTMTFKKVLKPHGQGRLLDELPVG